MIYYFLILLTSIFAGSVASIAGFGIGSFLTPVMNFQASTSLAIVGVSIAHFFGTALRFWKWRRFVNKKVLFSFGITSAVGGLLGAIGHHYFTNAWLTITFGGLLIFAGISGLTGFANRMRFSGYMAWIAGAFSGFFGGLVGNQGGIRSAAMFGFHLTGKEFIATATGIALAVDIARMPVYVASQSAQIITIWPLILIATVGVMIGTEIGVWIFQRIPEAIFKKIISAMILIIGIYISLDGLMNF